MRIHEFDPLDCFDYREFIRQLCLDLNMDRAGLFRYESKTGLLQGVLGINEQGELENNKGLIYGCTSYQGNFLQDVAQGWAPYLIINETVGPHTLGHPPGKWGRVALPVEHNGEIIGVLAADNLPSGRPITEESLPELRRYAEHIASFLTQLQVTQPMDLAGSLVEVLTDGIAITGTAGWIIYCNESFRRMYGFTRHEIVSHHEHNLFYPLTEAGETHPEWEEFRRDTGDWTGEVWNRKKEGSLLPVHIQRLDLYPRLGLHCKISVVKDLTPKKALIEAEHQRMLAEAQGRHAELEATLRLTRALQNEVNNPLQTILYSLHLMESCGGLNSDGRDFKERASTAVERLNDLMKRIQKLTEMQAVDTADFCDLDIENTVIKSPLARSASPH